MGKCISILFFIVLSGIEIHNNITSKELKGESYG